MYLLHHLWYACLQYIRTTSEVLSATSQPSLLILDPIHMDHFKVGRTRVRPTLHLSHAPANRVKTGLLDNRVRPTSEVYRFRPGCKRVRGVIYRMAEGGLRGQIARWLCCLSLE